MTTRALLAVAALTLAGCPSSTSPIDQKDAPDRVGVAWCEAITDCSVLGLALLSQTSCQVGAYQYRNDALALLDTWVADGTVTYDGAAMASCLDDLAAASCVDLGGTFADVGRCADAIVGQVALGGACEGSLQCTSGNYCDLDAACPGTCQPRGGASAACSDDAGCQPGFRCDNQVCTALLVADAPCDSAFACAPGFTCAIPDGQPSGWCRALVFTGTSAAACKPTTGDLCESPLVCAALDVAGDSWTCRAPSAVGAACNLSIPSACPTGSVCIVPSGQVSGSCTALPGEHERCLTSGGLVLQCQEDLTCDSATTTCVRRLDNGEACTIEAQCQVSCTGGTCADPTCTR